MKIKKLEIKGFKSFPDKTVLEFKPGITAVVGPNGCGKSNVLEAIRWVMGEQRVKSLRSKKMEDVIFNGSESRKPVGMAEVRLILSNTDGQGPFSMADYDEIMIARRLFRDGESNYEINGVACRLSDLVDFFLDTGVGKNSYAIIEQGKVDMVVASKPEDRRVLIEEAAGISRYKARRESTIKKLELTEQNLVRLNDVIAEVKRQGASLKRQAVKAEKYRSLSETLQSLDLALHAQKCRDARLRIRDLENALRAENERLSRLETRYCVVSAQLEKDRLVGLQSEKQLKDLLQLKYDLDMQISHLHNKIEKTSGRIHHLKDRRLASANEKENLEQNLAGLAGAADELKSRGSSVQDDLKAMSGRLEATLTDLSAAEQNLSSGTVAAERLKTKIFAKLQETAQAKNKRDALERRSGENESNLAKIESDWSTINAALDKYDLDRERALTAISATTEKLKAAAEEKERLLSVKKRLLDEIGGLRREVSNLERQNAARKARLDSLEEMRRSYHHYGDTVRTMMKHRASIRPDSIMEPVAEVIDVPAEFGPALAAALGDRLEHLVVTSIGDAAHAAKLLDKLEAGRSTFIPVSPRVGVEENEGHHDLTYLKDAVSFRPGFEDVGRFLLDGFAIADNIDQALEIWEEKGGEINLVTSSGFVINKYGEVTAGSHKKNREEVFEKRQEIGQLTEEVAHLQTSLDSAQAALTASEEGLEDALGNIEELDLVLNDLKMDEIRLRKDRELIAAGILDSERKLDVLEKEREQRLKDRVKLSKDLADAGALAAELERESTALAGEQENLRSSSLELTQNLKEKSKAVEEIRVKYAQTEERGRSINREYSSLCATIRDHTAKVENLAEELKKGQSAEQNLIQDLGAYSRNEKELMVKSASYRERINRLTTTTEELSSRIEEIEREASQLTSDTKKSRDLVHSLEMESLRIGQHLDSVVEKMVERYHVDPRTITPPEIAPTDEELAEIRAKMEVMGEVNLAAIAENRQVEERLTFLSEQEEDLKNAVDSLYATINAINKTTRERFRAAFDSVNEKFREIFPLLFRGGEAKLELTDEENLLETGIDIIVRPPGKRNQNMDLLSGGEKALTAVALIFSIFLIKPSPFCLLDEVDAPLDDANLDRFNRMLRDLAGDTQFLIVTHNKRSMEEADSLYGITMEEPGASRVLSVEFAG